MEKIFITGTGRCGTTFLIKLFSFLDFDTGFHRHNYEGAIHKNCNAGMERTYYSKFRIIKNPRVLTDISQILEDKQVKISTIIIPIRDFKISAQSRARFGQEPGGLWNAADEESQVRFYNEIMSNYLYHMVKHDIHTVFLDFDTMFSNKRYLFDKLRFILDERNISFEAFSSVYDEVSSTSK
jgi:hypothetical protein